MSLADLVIVISLILIFVNVIRFFVLEHKRGVPLDCISCPFLSDQAYDHQSCDHHANFTPENIAKIKAEIHQGISQ